MAQSKREYIGYKVFYEEDTIGFLNIDAEIEFDNAKVVITVDGMDYECNVELLQSKKSAPFRKKSTKVSL